MIKPALALSLMANICLGIFIVKLKMDNACHEKIKGNNGMTKYKFEGLKELSNGSVIIDKKLIEFDAEINQFISKSKTNDNHIIINSAREMIAKIRNLQGEQTALIDKEIRIYRP